MPVLSDWIFAHLPASTPHIADVVGHQLARVGEESDAGNLARNGHPTRKETKRDKRKL